MKTKITLLTILTLTFSSAYSQDSLSTIPNSIVKFLPIELGYSTFMIELESFNKEGTKSTSFGIGATYSERTDYDDETVSGLKGELIHRIYISPFAQRTSKKGRDYMLGVYGGLFVRGGYEKIESQFYHWNGSTSTEQTNTREGTWIFPGAMIGVARTYWDKLLVDLYIGAGIRAVNVDDSNPNFDDFYNYYYHPSPLDYGGVAPNIGFKIGLWL